MIGCWVTGSPKKTIANLSYLASLGIKQFKLMPCEFGRTSRWNQSEIITFVEICIEMDIEPVLTIWPSFEDPIANKYLFDVVVDKVISCGFRGLEIELEHNALKFDQETTDSVIDIIGTISEKYDIWIGGTTHPWHGESKRNARIMGLLDRFNIQAYSIRKRGEKIIKYKSKLGPGIHQADALRRAKDSTLHWQNDPVISIGLPAWSQNWPFCSEETAMNEAYKETIGFDVCYWSSVHILANKYAQDFIMKISNAHQTEENINPFSAL